MPVAVTIGPLTRVTTACDVSAETVIYFSSRASLP